MTTLAELSGGPLDGIRVRLRSRRAFLWVDVRPPHACLTGPRRHSVLYRQTVVGTYLYAGHTHALCGDCGAYVERVDGHVVSCSLCGGALAPAT